MRFAPGSGCAFARMISQQKFPMFNAKAFVPVPMKKNRHTSIRRTLPPEHPRRIAFVCFSRSLGGLELTTLRLATAMNATGNSVLMVVPPHSPLEQRASQTGLQIRTFEPRWKYGDVFAARQLGRTLREHRTEAAIMMQSKDLHLASLATLFGGNTKIVFYQQMDSGYDKRDALHRWVHSKLALWVTLTTGMRSNVLKFTSVPAQQVEVVPLGIDLRQFDAKREKKSTARRQFQLPQKGLLIGVLGRLDPQKGQEIFLRALSKVEKHHPSVHAVIAGDETAGEPGYRKHLKDVCNALGIQERVTFLPFTEQVPRLLAALDVFVLPSYCETYGLVVVEAMAMNCPVVATNAGGVPEIIDHGRTGLLVEPRDSDSLAQALNDLLRKASLRSGITRAARKEVIDRFDFGETVNHLLQLVNSL